MSARDRGIVVEGLVRQFKDVLAVDGIAGEDIPLESRIIFVCDAYHAMTTDRPYRRRLSHREAVRRLEEGAGSQFDPHVVEVALRVLEQLRDED